MSKIVKIQAPDGSVIKVEGPDDATDEQFIQQGTALYQQQKTIKDAQAAQFPTAAEQGGKPGAVAPTPLYQGLFGKLAQFSNAAMDTTGGDPSIDTGMNSPAVAMLTASSPGGATTKGISLFDALKQGPAVKTASNLFQSLKSRIPSTANAGVKFQQVMGAAKDIPIDTAGAESAVARAQELRQRGSSMPKVMNDFLKNRKAAVADYMGVPVADPMTYEVGRDFATSSGALSARESTAMTPQMKRQVAEFAGAMKDANRGAAARVGMGDVYDAAMKEYRQAKNLQEAGKIIRKHALQWILKGVGAGAGIGLGYELFKD